MNNGIHLAKVISEVSSDLFQMFKCTFFNKTQNLKALNIYGISICPPEDSFGVAFDPNGYGVPFVVIDKPESRFKGLSPGEMKIGNYVTGAYVYFKEDGSIEVSAPDVKIVASTKVEITSPLVQVSGNISANNFISTGHPTGADFNTHTHGGVTSGGASTGVPD